MARIWSSAAAIVLAVPGIAAAQGSVAGKWNTEYAVGVRNVNGEVSSEGKGQAVVTLTTKGDSVVGTFAVVPTGSGPTPPPLQLRGVRTGTQVELRSNPVEHTLRMNGDERKVTMESVYSFELKADSLIGSTHVHAVDGSMDGPDLPFRATRAKP